VAGAKRESGSHIFSREFSFSEFERGWLGGSILFVPVLFTYFALLPIIGFVVENSDPLFDSFSFSDAPGRNARKTQTLNREPREIREQDMKNTNEQKQTKLTKAGFSNRPFSGFSRRRPHFV